MPKPSKQEKRVELAKGQIWRRLGSPRQVRIVKAENVSLPHEKPFHDVTWAGDNFTGRGQCFEDSFRRRYELVKDA